MASTKHFNHIAEFGNLVILSGNISQLFFADWCARNLKGPIITGGSQLELLSGPKHSKINDYDLPISKTTMLSYNGFFVVFAQSEDLMLVKLKFDWDSVPEEFKKK